MDTILNIQNLKVYFKKQKKFFAQDSFIHALDDVSFTVYRGEILGIVGESGSGKSTLAKALIGLNIVTAGQILFEQAKRLDQYNKKEWRNIYKDIQLVFQDPIAALDPRMTIADIIMEPLHSYRNDLTRQEKLQLVIAMMAKVGLSPDFINRYPSEFSGGQCQRAAIARALIVNPKLLICDEAVSALDTTTKIQIVQLLKELQQALNLTIIFISHDLLTVKHLCDRVVVMYHGKIMEVAKTHDLFANPKNSYTETLLKAIPALKFTNV